MEQPNNVVHAGEATAGKLVTYILSFIIEYGAKILKLFVSGNLLTLRNSQDINVHPNPTSTMNKFK